MKTLKRIVCLFPLILTSCGGGYTKCQKLDFSYNQVDSMEIRYYSSEKGWNEDLVLSEENDIRFAYEQFEVLYTKESKRQNYSYGEKDCDLIYDVKFSLSSELNSVYNIKYYVYSHVDGTVVYPSGDAYEFYGNALYRTFDNIQKHINGEDDRYYLDAKPLGDKNLSPNFPASGYYGVGQKISFKVEIVTDVSFYVYLNNEKLDYVRTDGVIGGYEYYEFNMPNKDISLGISSSKFYPDREYSLVEVFPSLRALNTSNVISVSIKDDNDSVVPGSYPTTITTSTDKRDITYNVDLLSKPILIKTDEPITPGASFLETTFFLDSGDSISFTICDDKVTWRDFSSYQIFRLTGSPKPYPKITYPSE